MQNHRKKTIFQYHICVDLHHKTFLAPPKSQKFSPGGVENVTWSGHCPLQRRFVSMLGKTVIQKIPHGRVHLVPQVLILTQHFVYRRTTLIWPLVQISLICVSFFVVHVQSRSVIQGGFTLPVCFIQNDDFMSSLWQGNFLLSEHFNFIPHNINTSVKKIMINSIS